MMSFFRKRRKKSNEEDFFDKEDNTSEKKESLDEQDKPKGGFDFEYDLDTILKEIEEEDKLKELDLDVTKEINDVQGVEEDISINLEERGKKLLEADEKLDYDLDKILKEIEDDEKASKLALEKEQNSILGNQTDDTKTTDDVSSSIDTKEESFNSSESDVNLEYDLDQILKEIEEEEKLKEVSGNDQTKKEDTHTDLDKFAFIKEGDLIDNTSEKLEQSSDLQQDDLLDFDNQKQINEEGKQEDINEEIILEKESNSVNNIEKDNTIDQIEMLEIFNFLKEKCGDGFVSGLLFNNKTNKEIYNYNGKSENFSIFLSLFKEIQATIFKSEVEEKQTDYYLIDLKDNQTLMVLTYETHHFVLVFDKAKTNVGFLIYIIKSNIDKKYKSALK